MYQVNQNHVFDSPDTQKNFKSRRLKNQGDKNRWFAFRDLHRRCRYLADCYNRNLLHTVDLLRYRRDILWRMLIVIDSRDHSLSPAAALAVRDKLRTFLLTRSASAPSLVPA